MKNKRIVKAYDSINPTEAEKARMLEAILAEANLPKEPKSSQPGKKQEPIIYKKKPDPKPRRGSWIGPLAACLLMAVLCGFVLSFVASRQSLDPAYVDPSVLITGTPYDVVLNKYKTALEEEWTVDQCRIQDICSHVLIANYSVLDVGYAMKDLDGNGCEELLITNGQGLVWDMYTLSEDGTPVHVHRQEDGWPVYRIYENGIICAEYFESGRIFSYYVYQDGEFTGPELVIRQSSAMFTFEPAGQEPYFISEEEAEAKMAEYKIQELDQRSLLSLVSEDIAEKYRYGNNSAYAKVIEKYNRAISEDWTKEQCQIEGISTRFYMPEPVDFTIGQRMLDINGDGKAELLIGHDDNIWDIYTTLEDGTPIQLLSDEQDGWQYYLCEGQLILAEYYSKDDCYVEYYHLDGHQLVLYQELQYEDGQWQYRLDGQEWQPMTEQDVQTLTNGYKRIQPDWIPFEDDSAGIYQDIIDKYVLALSNNWSAQQCEQNDISPEILDETTVTHNLGWYLKDIDGNGVEELIISDGVNLFDLYVMMPHDGGPGHIICANGGERWQLCENGILDRFVGYSKGMSRTYFTLSGTDLVQKNLLCYTNSDPSNPYVALNQYSYGTNKNELKVISKEEAGKIIAGHRTMELDLNHFIPQTFDPDEVLEYQSLLELYQTAIREDWDPPTCMENGLSLMVAHRGEYYGELGYALQDLDGNGIQELIITDGLNIYDLYTIIQDEEVGPLHLASAMERIQYYLTSDGWIYNLGSGGAAVSYHTLYSLEGRELKLLDGYMMDADTDPNNPWFYYDGENRLGACPTAEAAAAMDAIVFQEIPFTPFQ